ncbi:hypothetical protein Btru_062830, partial [Bulinus truncatus]
SNVYDYQFECVWLILGCAYLSKERNAENIVFVVDSTSSMTSPIQLKRKNAKDFQKTKIEFVQTALLDWIEEIRIVQPECKIGMITFDEEVRVHTTNGPRCVDRNDLKNVSKLMEIGRDCSKKLITSRKSVLLKQPVKMLTAEGELKMDQALLIALGMENISQIIVLTDNILQYLLSDSDDENKQAFAEMASLAQSKQISVSMVSFNQCFLDGSEVIPAYELKVVKSTTVVDIFNTLVRKTSERTLSDDNYTDSLSKEHHQNRTKERDMATLLENSILKVCSAPLSGDLKADFFWSFLEYPQKSQRTEVKDIMEKLGMLYSLIADNSSQQFSSTQFGSAFIDASNEAENVDTNIIKVDIATKVTEKPKTVMPEKSSKTCENEKCQAVFSHLDTCENHAMGYEWICRFCFNVNLMENLLIFSPNDFDVCYEDIPEVDTNVLDEYKIIFVIDVSGSMSDFCKNSNVTRLQAVQASVIRKIKELVKKDPKRRVGLVMFQSDVTFYGMDRSSRNISFGLEDIDFLYGEGALYSNIKPLETMGQNIISVMINASPDGRTALGPAILVALGMASNSRGSKIIICTDGMANVGVGQIGSIDCHAFYQHVIQMAKMETVTISINSFDDCQLSVLESMARETAGTVRRISPTDLFIHIEEDVNRKVIATNAELKIVVPQEMYVREFGSKDKSQSVMTLKVGNIADCNSQISSFDFGFRENAMMNINWYKSDTGHYCIPFQVTTIYRDKEGKNLKRVYTGLRKLAKNSKEAKFCTHPEAVVTNQVQTLAKSLLQLKQSARVSSQVPKIIKKVIKLKKMDRIKPEIIQKLDTFILVLEKIKMFGLTDELSINLSKLASIS